MTAWNPSALKYMALPPCHVSVQFYVDKDRGLSCHMYQRSVDCFLGLPFNILSYSVLTYALASLCDMHPKELIISMGDAHIYTNHMVQVQQQLQRTPLCPAKLFVDPSIKEKPIEAWSINDFKIVGYFHHPTIKAQMAI